MPATRCSVRHLPCLQYPPFWNPAFWSVHDATLFYTDVPPSHR